MAKLTEVQYKEKYEKEKRRLEAIERKKELAKQKRNLVRISVVNTTSYGYGCFAVVKL